MKRTHGHGTASAKAVKNAHEKPRIRDYLVDLIGLKMLKFVLWASGDFVKLAWVLQLYSLLSSPFESQNQSNNQLRSDNYAVYLQKNRNLCTALLSERKTEYGLWMGKHCAS